MTRHDDYYRGPERRREAHLSEQQLDDIAERAADRAVRKMTDDAYKSIGKGLVSKFLWVVGVSGAAFYLWLQSKGLAK